VLFLVIPAVRYFVVQNKNRRIRENNEIAREYEEKIGKPDIDLARKLEEAEQFRRHENAEQSKQIVYRTDQDYLEQISDAEFVEKTREMQ
jgi:ribosome-binding protein aMBF1 (putative translation factor)